MEQEYKYDKFVAGLFSTLFHSFIAPHVQKRTHLFIHPFNAITRFYLQPLAMRNNDHLCSIRAAAYVYVCECAYEEEEERYRGGATTVTVKELVHERTSGG